MKDDSFNCTLIAHLRSFLLFYRLLYCLILPENRLFFGIWKVVEIEFVAIQAVIKPVEIKKTAHVAFNVDPEKGKFTDPAGAKVVTYDLDETDGDAHPIPKVEAKEGYEFTGWHVSGANEADWLPESEHFLLQVLQQL